MYAHTQVLLETPSVGRQGIHSVHERCLAGDVSYLLILSSKVIRLPSSTSAAYMYMYVYIVGFSILAISSN